MSQSVFSEAAFAANRAQDDMRVTAFTTVGRAMCSLVPVRLVAGIDRTALVYAWPGVFSEPANFAALLVLVEQTKCGIVLGECQKHHDKCSCRTFAIVASERDERIGLGLCALSKMCERPRNIYDIFRNIKDPRVQCMPLTYPGLTRADLRLDCEGCAGQAHGSASAAATE